MILITQQIQKKKKRHNFNSRLIKMVSAKNPTQNFSGKKKLFIVFSSLYADVLIHYKTQKKKKKIFWTPFCPQIPVQDFSKRTLFESVLSLQNTLSSCKKISNGPCIDFPQN